MKTWVCTTTAIATKTLLVRAETRKEALEKLKSSSFDDDSVEGLDVAYGPERSFRVHHEDGKSNRAKCAHCSKIITLDSKGRFRLHTITWTRPKGSDSPIIRSVGPCPGYLEQFEAPNPKKEGGANETD